MVQMVDDHHAKITEADFDIFREKLKLNEYTEDMPPHDGEECCMEKQQHHIMTQDDLSDCAEQGAFFSFCDTLDAESAVVNHNDATLVGSCWSSSRSPTPEFRTVSEQQNDTISEMLRIVCEEKRHLNDVD